MAANLIDTDPPVFLEFEKIPEDTSIWKEVDLKRIKQWIVLEKVHGANFSFYITITKSIRVAKRTSFITISDFFFGVHQSMIIPEIKDKLKDVLCYVVNLYPELSQISLHGELFGGLYLHPNVTSSSLPIQPVQNAIMYNPELGFIVYDIAIYSEDMSRDYLDYNLVMEVCRKFDLLYCKPLYIGKLNEACSYNLNYSSKIPQLCGLPKITDSSNIAEGIVVKPLKNRFLLTSKGPKRVIFKIKHPNFIEIKKLENYTTPTHPFKEEYLKYEILSFLNYNRVQSSISKLGFPIDEKELNILIKHILGDILIEYGGCNSDVWQNLNEEKKEYFKSIICSKIYTIYFEHFNKFNIKNVL